MSRLSVWAWRAPSRLLRSSRNDIGWFVLVAVMDERAEHKPQMGRVKLRWRRL